MTTDWDDLLEEHHEWVEEFFADASGDDDGEDLGDVLAEAEREGTEALAARVDG